MQVLVKKRCLRGSFVALEGEEKGLVMNAAF